LKAEEKIVGSADLLSPLAVDDPDGFLIDFP
jgi:hypothetical protein